MFRFVSSVFVLAGGLCFLAGADLLSGTRAMRWIGDRVAMLTGSPIGIPRGAPPSEFDAAAERAMLRAALASPPREEAPAEPLVLDRAPLDPVAAGPSSRTELECASAGPGIAASAGDRRAFWERLIAELDREASAIERATKSASAASETGAPHDRARAEREIRKRSLAELRERMLALRDRD